MQGKNLIGFEYSGIGSREFKTFFSRENKENEEVYICATSDEIEKAVSKAETAFSIYKKTSPQKRAAFLLQIKELLEKNQELILSFYCKESSLSKERGMKEFQRTTFQLELFAKTIEDAYWMNVPQDEVAGVILNKTYLPIGPIVVFGASNFPLAYSTIGGDSVAALAVGCPVIVKAHPMHAGTSSIVASLVIEAAKLCGMPDGVFSHLLDNGYEVAAELVQHEYIKGVGFTGSIKGGEALRKLSEQRATPIPVFAEMGSLNPVLIRASGLQGDNLEHYASLFASAIASDGGQFCTKPGLIFFLDDMESNSFSRLLQDKLNSFEGQWMLHPGIANQFSERIKKAFGINPIISTNLMQPKALEVTGQEFIQKSEFKEEFFGPFSLLIKCTSLTELMECLSTLRGQLTGTYVGNREDERYEELIDLLAMRAGRIIFNHVPTGVNVCKSMMHGGEYPASTDGRFTAVGPDSMLRFVRPVTWQQNK